MYKKQVGLFRACYMIYDNDENETENEKQTQVYGQKYIKHKMSLYDGSCMCYARPQQHLKFNS